MVVNGIIRYMQTVNLTVGHAEEGPVKESEPWERWGKRLQPSVVTPLAADCS